MHFNASFTLRFGKWDNNRTHARTRLRSAIHVVYTVDDDWVSWAGAVGLRPNERSDNIGSHFMRPRYVL